MSNTTIPPTTDAMNGSTMSTASTANGTTMSVVKYDLDDYKCSTEGLLMPFVNEYTWPIGGRAFIYLIGLLWSFFAVAIVADVFMCAIERITSKTTKVRIPDQNAPEGYQEIDVKVWNNTVANLSLLALGTSAPEILLSCIEIIFHGFKAGELGPSTIVGSASFNLLVISGICVMAIPSPEVRRVAETKVFAVTGFSCIFAYVWLAIVLLVISPNVVEIWEAVLTLLFFPLLILIAYLADVNFCMGKKKAERPQEMVGFSLVSGEGDEEKGEEKGEEHTGDAFDRRSQASIMRIAKDLSHDVQDRDLNEEEAAKLAAAKIAEGESHGKGWYRVNAIRGLSGGRKLIPKVMTSFQELYDNMQLTPEERADKSVAVKSVDHSAGGTKAVCEFTAAAVSVMENEGKVRIGVRRHGKLDIAVKVRVQTINGTAIAGEDYKPFDEVITFGKKEQLQSVFIEIVDDFEWEPDELFFVKISIPEQEDGSHEHVALGIIPIMQVTIVNDDQPGILEFAKPSLIVKGSYYISRVPVNRVGGCDGHVSVKWKTTDITAVDGTDYKGGEGVLEFDNQEISKTIDISLGESDKPERDECFSIELGECDGGAELGKIKKCIVTIVSDDEFNGIVSRLVNLTKANLDYLGLESSTWVGQFREAMNVNGGDLESATFLDYILHFLTFGWKIIFAFIPPASYWGGWPCFIISLAVIGLLTAIIGDLASIFGCLIGLPKPITAITFVALGTSMPDTFASKTAATMEKTADSSVGNVNGSNSVNVFLGLGLPWVIASIYWAAKDGSAFSVEAGSLGFSVIVYTCCAIAALGLLVTRRFLSAFGKAELGGPLVTKMVSGIVLICLWVLYVILSSLKTLKKI